MLDVVIQSIICFLAVYGLIQMGINIYDAIQEYHMPKNDEVFIIITVKNQQDSIEGFIRSLVWKNLNNEHGGMVPNILVIDMGSTDETVTILEKLHSEYNFIQIADSKNYVKVLEKLIH